MIIQVESTAIHPVNGASIAPKPVMLFQVEVLMSENGNVTWFWRRNWLLKDFAPGILVVKSRKLYDNSIGSERYVLCNWHIDCSKTQHAIPCKSPWGPWAATPTSNWNCGPNSQWNLTVQTATDSVRLGLYAVQFIRRSNAWWRCYLWNKVKTLNLNCGR